MGAINYRTSDYITIGYNCNNIDYNDIFYHENITDDYEQVKYILEQYSFYYFHIALSPGYYEGFYIDIENNFSWCFDNYRDKRAALKEITQIKKFLIDCLDFGCCAVYPGWCMGYADYKTTLKEIDAAVQNMRATVKSTPTWHTLPAGEKYA